ncbi:motility associated factor glycosyltransferase family protein [Pelagicoccus mobilis]|uniref:Motility associated factor glycosyltransferase family protein n=1 Tax=Pelagicoccus mobilis TaxID=415221 RepID=A0A934RWM6_9BACT|nr:6-hydroxymethylpterin diphosphokinase MptE-like protein [Pelagicoccus mobilis]MBK1875757.1 motility associated factor glycosyltransferase family protein [Pelagicoccus mobilis]
MMGGRKMFAESHPALAKRVESAQAAQGDLAEWKGRTADAERLLARWLEGKRFPHDSAIAVSGVGDGSHVKALLRVLPQDALVFCAEPDVGRFKAFLSSPAAESLLRDGRVKFGVGELGDEFFNTLAFDGIVDFTNAEPLIFAPIFNEAEEYYGRFFQEFAQQLELWRKLFGTNLTKSGLWQGNSFKNFNTLIRTPDPLEFGDHFKGLPMIMAGAGPSLNESLEFLRWAQDRAVIVAGNSSIRALVNGGVRPHFVLAADPYETTDRGFEGVDLGDTMLLCPFMVYPDVVKRFEGRISAWSHNNRVATYFRKVIGKERLAHVAEQGTISACAFDFAIMFGCSSLFFVGQDLAARADGLMHASDSFYADDGPDKAVLGRCRWLPGNTIEKVPVEEKLFVYLKTFEQLSRIYSKELKIKNRDQLKVFNLSRLGARIEHMPYLEFEEAKGMIETAGVGGVAKGWSDVQKVLAEHHVGWGRVGKVLREFRGYVEEICSHALRTALAMEQGDTLTLESAEAEKEKSDALIGFNDEFFEILNDGELKMELYVQNRAVTRQRRRSSSDVAADRLEELKGYFWAVAEGSYSVLSSIDSARETQKV